MKGYFIFQYVVRGWVSKGNFFKGMYKAWLEFLKEWGFITKKPSMGGVLIFSGTKQFGMGQKDCGKWPQIIIMVWR